MKLDHLTKYTIEELLFKSRKSVFCKIRKSYVPLTPEEKVRQSFLNYLIDDLKTPVDAIHLEYRTLSIDNYKGRVDILVNDPQGQPFIIYECKNEKEYFTDDVFTQALRYFTSFKTIEYIGFVIGEDVYLFHFFIENNEIKHVELIHHPTYPQLLFEDAFEIEEVVTEPFEEVDPFTNDPQIIQQFYDNALFSEHSHKDLRSLFISFYNWYFNTNSIIELENYKDMGIKVTAYGSANAKFAANWYRCFSRIIDGDPVLFCFALTTINYGSTEKTAIQVGVETVHSKRSSIQLNLDKHVVVREDHYEIWHNGTITTGKKGAAKIADFLDFVNLHKPDLIVGNKIFLGKMYTNDECSTVNKLFIENLFEYCWIRELFRTKKL